MSSETAAGRAAGDDADENGQNEVLGDIETDAESVELNHDEAVAEIAGSISELSEASEEVAVSSQEISDAAREQSSGARTAASEVSNLSLIHI